MILETSRISVPAESEQATIVRQFVRLAAHRYGCDALADNILQVTDELMAHAVAAGPHAPGDTVEVGIVPTQRGVRVEVSDHVPPRADDGLHPPAGSQESGLAIVAALAAEWGVRDGGDGGDGKTVWAEVARPGNGPGDA